MATFSRDYCCWLFSIVIIAAMIGLAVDAIVSHLLRPELGSALIVSIVSSLLLVAVVLQQVFVQLLRSV